MSSGRSTSALSRIRVVTCCALTNISTWCFPLAVRGDVPVPLHREINHLVAIEVGDADVGRVSDAQFLRRATLDLTGEIPTAAAVREFCENGADNKRETTIDRLLESPEYRRHMQRILDGWLMRRRPFRNIAADEWRTYLRHSVSSNKHWDVLTTEILKLIWWNRPSHSYEIAHRVRAHSGWIRSIALSPNRKLLASAGNDRIIRIRSVRDQKLVSELPGHQHPICSLAFHPAGDRLVSADQIGEIKDWHVSAAKVVRDTDGSVTHVTNKNNRGASGGLRGLLFNSVGQFLIGSGVIGGGDPLGQAVNPGGIVFDWNTGQRSLLLKPKGNELGVAWGIDYHPTEQFVTAVSGGMSAKHVYFWRTTDEYPFHTMELPSPGRSLTLHPDGKHLAVAMHDGKVQISSLA